MKSAIDHGSKRMSKEKNIAFEDSPKSVVYFPDRNPDGIFYKQNRQPSPNQTVFQGSRKSNLTSGQMKHQV
jgi:hypothetical protein